MEKIATSKLSKKALVTLVDIAREKNIVNDEGIGRLYLYDLNEQIDKVSTQLTTTQKAMNRKKLGKTARKRLHNDACRLSTRGNKLVNEYRQLLKQLPIQDQIQEPVDA